MPPSKGSRILTTRSLCHYENDSSRSSGLRPSPSRTLTSRSRSEVGPICQPAEQSVLFGQLANRRTYAGSRRPGNAARVPSIPSQHAAAAGHPPQGTRQTIPIDRADNSGVCLDGDPRVPSARSCSASSRGRMSRHQTVRARSLLPSSAWNRPNQALSRLRRPP